MTLAAATLCGRKIGNLQQNRRNQEAAARRDADLRGQECASPAARLIRVNPRNPRQWLFAIRVTALLNRRVTGGAPGLAARTSPP